MTTQSSLTGEEFIAAVTAGKGELVEERRITGPVLFRGGEVSALVRSLYVFFEGEVDFSDTTFHGGIDFSGCTFAKTLSLRNVRIDGDLILDDVHVKNLASIWGARLPDLQACDLGGAEVTGDITISRSVIAGSLASANVTVGGALVIRGTEVDGGTNISNARIAGDLTLGSWASSASLEQPNVRVGLFNAGIHAINMRVKGHVDLHGLQVDGAMQLWGGTFKSSIFARPFITSRGRAQPNDLNTGSKNVIHSIVTGEMSLSAAQVSGHVQFNSLQVGGDLTLRSLSCGALHLRPYRDGTVSGPPCEVARLLLYGARVDGDMLLPMIRVTGRAGLSVFERGLRINNCTIGGDLQLWTQRAFTHEKEPSTPVERDSFSAGAVIAGDVEIRGTTVSGECDLTNTWASGSIRLNDSQVRGDVAFRSRSSLLGVPILDPAERDRLLQEPPPHLRARAAAVDLTMLRCENDIDLTGLDVVPEGIVAPDLRAGSIVARSIQVASSIQLCTSRDVAGRRIEDATRIPGAADFEGAQARRFLVSARDFDVAHPVAEDVARVGVRLAGARFTELAIQPETRSITLWERFRGMSDVRFPAPMDLRDLTVDVWSIGAPASARRFSALLACDPVFRRDTFVRIEQNLRNVGHDAAATEIYKEMCRRERQMDWRNASRWPGRLWRWPLTTIGELFLYLPFSRLMGFGTAPLRLLFVIGLLWAAMMPVYYVPANFQESLPLRALHANKGAPRPPSAAEWSGATPLFASARYHLPIVGLATHDEWELAGDRRTCWTMRPANTSNVPPGCTLWLPLAPEHLGVLVTLLNWALWPLVLTFTLRKLLR